MPGSKKFYRYACVNCGGRVVYRYTHLYVKEKNGYMCQSCWDKLVDAGE